MFYHFFADSLPSYSPELLVVSGLHLLEGQNETFRKRRVRDLCSQLKKINPDIPIHLELASMVKKEFMEEITEQLFPLIDSIGLNEQELGFLSKSLGGPHSTGEDIDQWPPEIGMILDSAHVVD